MPTDDIGIAMTAKVANIVPKMRYGQLRCASKASMVMML
jgi:hypothetical protein